MTTLIGDPGSTHMCQKQRALDLIHVASTIGLDAIKFQLFGHEQAKPGNIMLPREWWPDLMTAANNEGITLFASVWSPEDVALLVEHEVPWVKFAYSQRFNQDLINKCLGLFERVYVSCDYLDFDQKVPSNLLRLWVDSSGGSALYPSTNDPDWDAVARGWDGASIHSLNPMQLCKASWAGLEHLEFHMRLGDEIDELCPDGQFAFSPAALQSAIEKLGDE